MSSAANGARALFKRAELRLSVSRRADLLTFLPTGTSLSGPALLREIHLTAGGLAGVGMGDRSPVLLALSHPYSLILAVPALWSLGSVPILTDATSTRDELQNLTSRFSPAWVLGDTEEVPATARPILLPGLPPLRVWRPRSRRPPTLPGSAVLIRTTSGSSGPSRGVALSPSQILADARNIFSSLEIGQEVRSLAAVPLAHAFGFSVLLVPLLFQDHPTVLLEQPLPEQFRAALGMYRSLFFPGVPYLFDLLCRAEIRPKILARLRLCVSAGAPLPVETASRFLKLAGSPIRNFYGTSECGAVACDRTPRGSLPAGCVGTPLRGVSLSLGRAEGIGRRRGVRGRHVGRICVQSAAVALGYVGGGSRARFGGGNFLTGDLGRIDSRGRLHLLGRLDQMINVGGRKVWPEEVERVLIRARGVREAAVLAIPDPSRGEAVSAAVSASRGVRPEDLFALCRRCLSPHKVPRRIQLLPTLPRTRRGKVDRSLLRSILADPSGLAPGRGESQRLATPSPGRKADQGPAGRPTPIQGLSGRRQPKTA